uniref:Uncharacterized protein n=1 Tax=Myotis myotis TaxID=51298 RepID=A0A7J7RT16_MYOMY|nr:hypothetical protein mMyoMyo1_010200 [Myotis myotis]
MRAPPGTQQPSALSSQAGSCHTERPSRTCLTDLRRWLPWVEAGATPLPRPGSPQGEFSGVAAVMVLLLSFSQIRGTRRPGVALPQRTPAAVGSSSEVGNWAGNEEKKRKLLTFWANSSVEE